MILLNLLSYLLRSLQQVILVLLIFCHMAFAVDAFDMKQLMGETEFNKAGLHKLDEVELQQLSVWLKKFTAHKAPQLVSTPTIRKLQKKPRTEIIDGKFYGWRGKTIFRLKNGEIWQQRMSGKYKVELDNPKVIIKKNFLGFYEMKVVKTGKSIGIKHHRKKR